MARNLIVPVLACFLVILSVSCQKNDAGSENLGGTSLYTFEGTSGGCSAPLVSGIYIVGTPLSASNTITLSVNVTVKGSYNIRTTSANGVYFSGSGVFTSTGLQTVILTGTGTPVKMGNFYFLPSMNNTCNFIVSFSATGSPAVFTYAGAPNACVAPIISGTYVKGVNLGPNNYVDLAVNVTAPGAYTILTNNTNGISFSGSGVFTATGPQIVRLMGSGAPEIVNHTTFRPSVNGCSFDITVTASTSSAAFSYNGGSGDCVGIVKTGAYIAGVPLNASNTVIVQVNVTVPGSYSVITSSFNGVTFSASGNFTTTGPNTITLTSTNTPINPGNAPYVLPNGCSFGIFYQDPSSPIDSLKCNIDGVEKSFNRELWAGVQLAVSPYRFDLRGKITGAGAENMRVIVVDNINPLVTGFGYTNGIITTTSTSCVVVYSESATVDWSSSPTILNTFVVNFTSITSTRVTGTFSGKLYLNNGPSFKTITNGIFSIGY